jgi:hypothetical protein
VDVTTTTIGRPVEPLFQVQVPLVEPEGSRDRFAHRVGAGREMGTQRGDQLCVAGRDEVGNSEKLGNLIIDMPLARSIAFFMRQHGAPWRRDRARQESRNEDSYFDANH